MGSGATIGAGDAFGFDVFDVVVFLDDFFVSAIFYPINLNSQTVAAIPN